MKSKKKFSVFQYMFDDEYCLRYGRLLRVGLISDPVVEIENHMKTMVISEFEDSVEDYELDFDVTNENEGVFAKLYYNGKNRSVVGYYYLFYM